MKKAIRWAGSVLLGILLSCLLLSACGIPEGVEEEKIIADITEADSFFTDYGLSVDSGTVSDRKTNMDEKTENMQLRLKASSSVFTYEASYQLVYHVEEDSWRLKEWEKINDSYQAAASASKSEAEAVLKKDFEQLTYVSEDSGDNACSFQYTAVKTVDGITTEYVVTLPFSFSLDGWTSGPVEARETGFSGKCGDNLTWKLDEKGELTINGSGDMTDYKQETPAPWSRIPEKFSVKDAVIEDGATHLGSLAFAQCAKLESVTIPASVVSSGAETFANCTGLKQINYGGSRARWNAYLPAAIKDDMQGAFHSAVSDVELVDAGTCGDKLAWTLDADGVLTIAGEGPMTDYTIYPKSVGTDALPENPINSSPWGNQTGNIKSVIVEPGVTSIGEAAFALCANLTKAELPIGVSSLGTWCFLYCKALSEINVPDTVSELGSYAFCECESLGAIDIPEGIEIIGWRTFYNCKSLKQLRLPNSLREIFDLAFYNCTSLTEIIIPEGVTYLQGSVFENCTGLTTVSLPLSLTIDNHSSAFGSAVFAGCTGIKDVKYSGTEQQWKDNKMDTLQFPSDDYTVHFSDGGTFHHYIHSPSLSKEEIGKIACDYWKLSYACIDGEADSMSIRIQEIVYDKNGRAYYPVGEWVVTYPEGVQTRFSFDVDHIWVDAESGEVLTEEP